MEEIPEEVIQILAEIREEGKYNMMDYTAVVGEALGIAVFMKGSREAAIWLMENKERYVEALKEMGERRRGQ